MSPQDHSTSKGLCWPINLEASQMGILGTTRVLGLHQLCIQGTCQIGDLPRGLVRPASLGRSPIFHYKGGFTQCPGYYRRPGTQLTLCPEDHTLTEILPALYTGDASRIIHIHASTPAFRKTAQWLTLPQPHILVTVPRPQLCPLSTQAITLALEPTC